MFVYAIPGIQPFFSTGEITNTGIPYYGIGIYFGIGIIPIPSPFFPGIGIGYRYRIAVFAVRYGSGIHHCLSYNSGPNR